MVRNISHSYQSIHWFKFYLFQVRFVFLLRLLTGSYSRRKKSSPHFTRALPYKNSQMNTWLNFQYWIKSSSTSEETIISYSVSINRFFLKGILGKRSRKCSEEQAPVRGFESVEKLEWTIKYIPKLS